MKYEDLQKLSNIKKFNLLEKVTCIRYNHLPQLWPPGTFNLHFTLNKLITTQEQKVNFLRAIRDRMSVDAPKNKVGTPMVSDYDVLASSEAEQADSILMAFC
jgi:hypothetical protein